MFLQASRRDGGSSLLYADLAGAPWSLDRADAIAARVASSGGPEVTATSKIAAPSPQAAPGSSIIPSPGSPPAVPPTTATIHLNGGDYTIAAGTKIYGVGIATVFDGYESEVTNDGTVWLESHDPHGWFLTGQRGHVSNGGLIYVHGETQVELGPQIEQLINSGSVFVISDSGWARGIATDVYPLFVDNSGLIAAQSLGIDNTPDPVYLDIWNATGIEASGQTQIVNHAAGRILAEAPNLAIGIFSPGIEVEPGKPIVTNEGLIEANATAPGGTSIGIYISQPGYNPAIIVNSGIIRADIAIYGTYSADTVANPVEHVQNQLGGVIDGLVLLDIGDDEFLNDGRVIGHVDMGGGNDVFSGSGTVSGVVDMGFDQDNYSGSGAGDRAAGGRGDDSLRGNGGADLLLGGFGNDSLRGDGGNDGLIGEWGDDTIETLGGDYVEGGLGNDRIVLGDYSFEAVRGEGGTDTLVLDDGARNFSLAQMVAGGRISGFEIIELKAGQQLALNANSIMTVTGGAQALRIDAAADNTVHLAGNWARGADSTIGGTLYEVWTQGGATVTVTEAATVTPLSTPAFGGLDPIAAGDAALRPGAAAGLDYTDPAYFVRGFPLYGGEFTVDAAEIFYSDGAPVFVASTSTPQTFTNNGEIDTFGNAPPEALGIAWGLEFHGPTTMVNNGLIYVEEVSPLGRGFFQPSFGVTMGGAVDTTRLENYGEITVYSVPGHAIGVQNIGVFRNEGLVAAISEHSRAIAVNTVMGSHIVDDSQTFFNTGVIYAEAGGVGRQTAYLGDTFVPDNYAATGVGASGSVTNDGDIIARLGPNATPGLVAVGVYVLNHFGNQQHLASVTNNGTIEGTIAIKFGADNSFTYSHRVTNNGLLIGNVEFENANRPDTYEGSGGEIRGTVFGFGGNDSFTGGQFADSFEGGVGDDMLDGAGGSDTAAYAFAGAGVSVDLSLTGAQNTVGAGSDTLVSIENLLGSTRADSLRGNDGANILDGGAGADSLAGGLGDDSYVIDNAGDVVTEAAGGGADQVQSSVTFTLGAEVENLTLGGTAAIDGTGNASSNSLYGNDAANVLDGRGGADRLEGGLGNDSYFVDNAGDTVWEGPGGGVDSVSSTVSFALSTDVENLTLTGAAAATATGNALDNILTGNGAANSLLGNSGNDTLDGGAGNDTMRGGSGNDLYRVDSTGDLAVENALGEGLDRVESAVSYSLGAFIEQLVLTGSAASDGTGNGLDNLIVGNSAANVLDGGAGADFLDGGAGDDTYVVDSLSDGIAEAEAGGTDTVRSAVSFSLGANLENLVLTGTAAAGNGNALANVITGNASVNTLDGGAGADVMKGGAGNDVYLVDNAGDQVVEVSAGDGVDLVSSAVGFTLGTNVENLVLIGIAAIDGTGNALNNAITGNAAANTLDGRAGADVMKGGAGDDIYVVDNRGDQAIELLAGDGHDAVFSSVTYTLGANLDHLGLTGTAAINGTGNAANNSLTGNGAANILDGGAGADVMKGGAGNDIYVVDNRADQAIELLAGDGHDSVYSSVTYTLAANLEHLGLTGAAAINGTGNAAVNSLTGNAAANALDGRGGADVMKGGAGNDTYVVDNRADQTIELLAGDGHDSVYSSVSYTLATNLEHLGLTGTAAINATGNAAVNSLTGNSAANTLDGRGGADVMKGGAGNDIYVVDNVADQAIELNAADGHDSVYSSVSYSLAANVEHLGLTGTSAINGNGNASNNSLTGNSAANTLDGRGGADVMKGGAGDDIYVVDNISDQAVELSAADGHDSVYSSASFTIGGNIEFLALTGSAAINGTGNGDANGINGNSGANILDGRGGSDLLKGGGGADEFQFSTALGAGNVDHVFDFAGGVDGIRLDNAVFSALGLGALSAGAFQNGTAAIEADDRILYDAATGRLFYDYDGTGAGAAVLFAVLDTRPATLSASDFTVI